MSFADWVKNGWLREHAPTKSEIAELLAVAKRDLKDSRAQAISHDWQFGIAYNAALQLARAALIACGYETLKGDSHHFRAIDSLALTLHLDAGSIDTFQTFRKKRATGIYEAVGRISPSDAREMLQYAETLQKKVLQMLKDEHGDLLSDASK